MIEKPNNLWNFFEYIVVNTVNNSKEFEGFKENMKAVGIKNYRVRSGESVAKSNVGEGNRCNTFTKIFKGGKECCGAICRDLTKRSIELISDAYNKGFNNIFLLEDDARFELPFDFKKLNRIIEWLKNNKKWEAFYFGYILAPNPLLIPISLDICRLFNPNLTHAVVINRRGMKKILDYVNKNGNPDNHIDVFYRNILNYKYGSIPVMNYQCKEPALYKKGMKLADKQLFDFEFFGNIDHTTYNKAQNSWWIIILVLCCVITFLFIFLITYYNWPKKRKNRRRK